MFSQGVRCVQTVARACENAFGKLYYLFPDYIASTHERSFLGQVVRVLAYLWSILWSTSLCTDCTALVDCVLAGATQTHPRWETLSSDQTKLRYCKSHLNGTIDKLSRSANRRCQLCQLLLQELRSLAPVNGCEKYCLFQWIEPRPKCQIQVAFGDVQRFVTHVSQWSRPSTICLYKKGHKKFSSSEPSSSPALAGSPAPDLYLLPERDLNVASNYARAKNWLDQCKEDHGDCVRPHAIMPKRVLDLGNGPKVEEVKLRITSGKDHDEYAALSYSWGQGRRYKTKKATLEDHCRGIYVWKLPRTLRDGIDIAKSLGFRYLWIDALCIIQNDQRDFDEQVAALPEIYGNSTLNISASNAATTDDGILGRSPDLGTYIGFHGPIGSLMEATRIWAGPPRKTLDLEEKYISTRGWVFQERLVSRATLHYTNEGLVWECGQGTMVDHDQSVYGTDWKSKWKATMTRFTINQAFLQSDVHSLFMNELYRNWFDWICAYSERHLHKCEDKFPAIEGVALRFAERFGLTNVAGLWREDLVSGLLWRRHNRMSTLTRYPTYVAPTWSWGSVGGRLEYRDVKLTDSEAGPIARILRTEVNKNCAESLLYGPGSYMEVKGIVQKIVVDKNIHPGVRQKDHQECGVREGFLNNTNVLVMLDVLPGSSRTLISCSALRLGSFDAGGRRGDIFLLLQQEEDSHNRYQRIGLAETDPWKNVLSPTPHSGILNENRPSIIELI